MRILIGISLLATVMSTGSASAGEVRAPVKYSVESGVKVYRHPLSTQQIEARRTAQLRAQIRMAAQAKAKAAAAQQAQAQQATNAAYSDGYDKGFESGFEKAQAQAERKTTKRNRYNYGRRYTTSIYPIGYYRRSFGRRGLH